MKRIVHLSDLHFGTERPDIVDKLILDINALEPDLIVVSGDLTQRARLNQFYAARAFLSKLNCSQILCVPGNHDIALYNIVERFLYPFFKYKKIIKSSFGFSYHQDKIALLGINSVTPYKPMGGFVTKRQLEEVMAFFKNIPPDTVKVIIMHHNLIRSERHKIINDAEKIINTFASCNINLILCGHIHFPCIEQLKRNYLSHNMFVITAGTPTSTRTLAPNSFNVIEVDEKEFVLSIRTFNAGNFETTRTETLKW